MKNIASPSSLKAGNVLALLNTLYTSGFATSSPGMPMLKDRTMHTLYAISFIVYTCNAAADWLHVYCTLRGLVTSYPLNTWLVITLVSCVVAGSMLTGLLLVLCVENAFAHRLDIKPYRSGLTIIVEAIVEWLQAFNNFRVSFLIMALHDFPMTIINFFIITSCRCVGPQIIPWSLFLSCVTTNASLVWRLTMLYFAYRRLVCPTLKKKAAAPTPGVYRFPSPHEHFLEGINTSDEARMREFDELWPIRWARRVVYGVDKDPSEKLEEEVVKAPVISTIGPCSLCYLHLRRLIRLITCISLSVAGYIAFLLSCCAPCCYHYTCRRNSFHHRHAFARNFVRYFTYLFHYCTFFFSLLTVTILFSMNTLLLTSVHILGSNSIPPEINQVCVAVALQNRSIELSLSSAPILWNELPPKGYDSIMCKPIWEDGGLHMGLKRKPAGPWQTRQVLNDRDILAISTQVIINGTDVERPFLLLKYDWAVISKEGTEVHRTYTCRRGDMSTWNITLPTSDNLPFIYFKGCEKDWRFMEVSLIGCSAIEKLQTTTPLPRWVYYPIGKGAYYPPVIPPRRKGLAQSKEEALDRDDKKEMRQWHKKRKHTP